MSQLKLTGEAATPTALPEMQAAIGSSVSHPLTLSNPMGEALPLAVRMTNGADFKLEAANKDSKVCIY